MRIRKRSARKMEVKERVAKLRELMEKNGIDVYMIPTADFHNS